jgi:hypothetical protein
MIVSYPRRRPAEDLRECETCGWKGEGLCDDCTLSVLEADERTGSYRLIPRSEWEEVDADMGALDASLDELEASLEELQANLGEVVASMGALDARLDETLERCGARGRRGVLGSMLAWMRSFGQVSNAKAAS